MDPRPEGASLSMPDSRIDLLCCSVILHLKGTWETHQTFCMRLVLVSLPLLIYNCMSIIIETLHDQPFSLTSEDSLSDSKPRVPEDQGTGMTSQCMKLVLVSFTLIYSATCALLSFHINVCAGYMCFVKL